ncbi:MAG TPA: SAF domain-containing protein [Mycobacteriales bacterium]|nr:SAF domain-containing protein [Mycobacteriales bacterium]
MTGPQVDPRVRRLLLRHRRPLAGAFAALAVAATISALRAQPPGGVTVLVAARELPAGTVLTPGDLRAEQLPAADVPDGAAGPGAALFGRTLAASAPRGLPITGETLVGPAIVPAGRVAATVHLSADGDASVLTVGDVVDLIAARADGSAARVVGAQVPVLLLPANGILVVAVTPAEALTIAAAAAVDQISAVLE